MLSREKAIAFIQCYTRLYLRPPLSTWPDIDFQERSLSRWAIQEIFDAIERQPNISVSQVLSKFIAKMLDFEEIPHDKEVAWTFTVALNEARDLQQALLKYEKENNDA